MNELDSIKAAVYIKAIISGFIAGQEFAGISRKEAGENFMDFLQEHGGDPQADSLISAYEVLKKLI